MSLPPFDGTGWIEGMPGLPGGEPPPPVLTLTLTAEPAAPAVGTPLVIAATANVDPPDPVVLNYTLNAGAPEVAGPLTETGAMSWSNSVDTLLLIPGSVYDLWVTSGAAVSNHVTVTITATVAALTAFAEANNIEVPVGAKKAELLALVTDAATAPGLTLTEEN